MPILEANLGGSVLSSTLLSQMQMILCYLHSTLMLYLLLILVQNC